MLFNKFQIKKISILLVGFISIVIDASEFKPLVVFEEDKRFDKSFNQAMYQGLGLASQSLNVTSLSYSKTNELESIVNKASSDGYNPIVVGKSDGVTAIKNVSALFPETIYIVIDGVVANQNVVSVMFSEHESAFLVGALAALTTKTNRLGFIAGQKAPLVNRYLCGFEQGARYVNSDISIAYSDNHRSSRPWSEPEQGYQLAMDQFEQNVDIIFAVASVTGLGVFQAAKDSNKFAIGVESNQNYIQSGAILTSAVKNIAEMVNYVLAGMEKGSIQPGVLLADASINGIGWSKDEHNSGLIELEHIQIMSEIEQKLKSGEIIVNDYIALNVCNH